MSLSDQSIPGLTLRPHAASSIHPRQENGLGALAGLADLLIQNFAVDRQASALTNDWQWRRFEFSL